MDSTDIGPAMALYYAEQHGKEALRKVEEISARIHQGSLTAEPATFSYLVTLPDGQAALIGSVLTASKLEDGSLELIGAGGLLLAAFQAGAWVSVMQHTLPSPIG